jgi:hypothetical protein
MNGGEPVRNEQRGHAGFRVWRETVKGALIFCPFYPLC